MPVGLPIWRKNRRKVVCRLAGHFFVAAFFAAQRFFRAATIVALPAAVSTRFSWPPPEPCNGAVFGNLAQRGPSFERREVFSLRGGYRYCAVADELQN